MLVVIVVIVVIIFIIYRICNEKYMRFYYNGIQSLSVCSYTGWRSVVCGHGVCADVYFKNYFQGSLSNPRDYFVIFHSDRRSWTITRGTRIRVWI